MNAIQTLLTEHIGIWTDADTEKKTGRGRGAANAASVYGIRKLRELILELAVRGKLVSQDANDEPASALLKRLQAEKIRLITEGKIKKDKPLPEIAEGEKPYTLPKGWLWVRLPEVYYSISPSGNKLLSSAIKETGKVPVVDQGKSYIAGYTDEVSLLIQLPGPVIVFGDHTTERKYIDFDFVAGADGVKILRPIFQDERFFFRQLLSYSLEERGYARHFNVLNVCFYAMPPLAEQHRIVAKVDELMALCDKLETRHNNAAEAHEKLVNHLLATLTQSQNAAGFSANWQRISAHFDTLFSTEASIDALKQTLLQLAVMGKLVPQDPNDEPASALLKRIQAEKAKLVAEGKIKKEKPLAVIADDEKPFALPQRWEWARLDELARLITKGSSPKWQGVSYTDNPEDVMFVTSENVGSYTLLLDSPKYVEKKFNDIEPRSILENGDFLMNIVGASIGRTAVYDIDILANINQAVCLIRISTFDLSRMFLLHFFNSETCLEYMFDKQVDNARPNLSMGNIAKFLIPIPPLVEQHRIVAKVDELMALCDQLKTRITLANQLQQKLADVVVEQAIA